jgi:hypothetical protein
MTVSLGLDQIDVARGFTHEVFDLKRKAKMQNVRTAGSSQEA